MKNNITAVENKESTIRRIEELEKIVKEKQASILKSIEAKKKLKNYKF